MDIYDFYRNDPALQSYLQKQADAICRHPGFSKSDFEEQLQILVCHLFEKRQKYDPGRSSLWTFAVKVTDNKVRSILRSRKAQKRDPKREECSVNDVILGIHGDATSVHETIPSPDADHVRQVELAADLALFMSRLDPLDKAVLLWRNRGMTHEELCEQLDLTDRELKAALKRIDHLATKMKLDDYFAD